MANAIHGTARMGFNPVVFKPVFKRRLLDSTILSRITNNDFAGEFKGASTEIEVPIEPLVKSHKRRQGDPVRYQRVATMTERFKVGRQACIAFMVEREEVKFSSIGDLPGQFMTFGRTQRLPELEAEFYADIFAKSHPANQGNDAGLNGENFDLGSALLPVRLWKTQAQADAASGDHNEVAPDFIVHLVNTLHKQPGSTDIDPFVIISTDVADRIQTSELKQADLTGDDISIVRKDIKLLGTLGGAKVYVTNLLPSFAAEPGDAGPPVVPGLPFRSVVLAGDMSAVTYWGDVGEIDMDMKDVNTRGTFSRAFFDYEWFVRYPERLATGIVAIGK